MSPSRWTRAANPPATAAACGGQIMGRTDGRTDGQTDGRTDAGQFYRPCSAYTMGAVSTNQIKASSVVVPQYIISCPSPRLILFRGIFCHHYAYSARRRERHCIDVNSMYWRRREPYIYSRMNSCRAITKVQSGSATLHTPLLFPEPRRFVGPILRSDRRGPQVDGTMQLV